MIRTPLEFFGLGKSNQSDNTPIPQLGINSHIAALSRASEAYFLIPTHALAKDRNDLAVVPQQLFNPLKTEHARLLRDCTQLFNEQSKRLKEIDKKLALSLVTGIVATSLSFIPFVGYFSLLGWGSALYYFNQRTHAYRDYQESMTLLAGCCNWSLGKINSNSAEVLTSNLEIRNMMVALYPVLNEKQARHLIADEIEEVFAEELRAYETNASINLFDKNIAQSKKGAQFQRCIYGFNKGNALDFIDAFLTIFPDIYRAIQDGFRTLQQRWSSPAATVSSLGA